MEFFSLYDISATVYTKSTQRIILPMIAELYHLMIEIKQREVNHKAFVDLEKATEELSKATEELACIASRLAEESGDEVLKREMLPAAQTLMISGKNILLDIQKLLTQPDACSSKEDVAVSAKRIVVGTVKVLQTQDDATIRRIIQAAHWLLECLLMLDSAEDISAMLSAFPPFSEALLLLTNLTESFLWDLKESSHQKRLAQTLQILKNCITHLQCPSEQQMKLSKNYIFNLANSVNTLISLLQSNREGINKVHERYGLFPQYLCEFLNLLSSPQPTKFHEGKISVIVEVIIFYCMLFADSSRTALKQELIHICYHLLKFRKIIAMDVSDNKEECFTMKIELEHLYQAVRSAVIYQILDNLGDIKGPMKRLIEATVEPHSPVGKGSLLRRLKPFITTFFNHSTKILKAASLALVTCPERETAEDIDQCIDQLKSLLARVPALLSEMSQSPRNSDVSEKLHFMAQIWSSTAESLLMCLDKVLDLHEFLNICVQEMRRHKEASEKSLDTQHSEQFSWHASCLSRQATQVVEYISRHVAKARDPIFQNQLLVLIKQMKNAIMQTEVAVDQCMSRMTSLQAKEGYSEKAKELIEFACSVQKGLNECKQPDVLSPLWAGVQNLKISRDVKNVLTSWDPLELNTKSTIKQSSPDKSELVAESLDKYLTVYCSLPELPRGNILYSEGRVNLHPLISKVITATKLHDVITLIGTCADLMEFASCCVVAAKEALTTVTSSVSDKLLHYKGIVVLIPCFISLAREVEATPAPNLEPLLQAALLLSEKIDETKQGLVFVAGSWYSLAKQFVGFVPSSDFRANIQSLDEIMEILETIVQLIDKVTHSSCKRLLPEHPCLQEISLRIQFKFTDVRARTKHLEKALDVNKSYLDIAKQESFDASCILWSVCIQALLNIVDQFIGRDILALGKLQTEIKHQLCLQRALAAVSESSLRIQEAAKLSFFVCGGQDIESEIPSQREEVKMLTASVLQVANALAASPLASPNLLVHFELLRRKLAITTKALLLQLNGLNGDYLSSIQNVVRLSQLVPSESGNNSDLIQKEAFEKKAALLKANIHMVKKIIRDSLEESSDFLKLKDNLLIIADHLLLLTDEIMGRAGQFQSQVDKEHLLVDSLLYEWSAEAGYLINQLQCTKSISETVLQVVKRCLQNYEEHIYSDQAFCKIQISSQKEEDRARPQSTPPPKHKPVKTGERRFFARNKTKVWSEDLPRGFPPSHSECSTGSKWQDSGCLLSQVTEEMTIQVSHMAQFLKRKGPITSKEQLLATATQIISGGQTLVKYAGIIAKNCHDEKCATELLCALEQIKTINYQLSIITRVTASTGSSRSSTEHLVSNAQNLIRGALWMLKAAEAACIKGL